MVKKLNGATAPSISSSASHARALRFDVLEPRMMFDGAMAADLAAATPPDPAADDGGAIAPSPTDALPSALPTEPATQVVVFIDANVAEADVLAASAPAGAEVYRLSDGDGLSQIATILDGRTDITAIHILSHGEPGSIHLGSTRLTSDTIDARLGDLQTIGKALAPEGDILIYGCDVAAGAGGDLLAQLAAATGADIAASTGATGAAALGGDWALEAEMGEVTTEAVAAEPYGGLLAMIDTATNEFRVNTTTLDAQSDSDVAVLSDGTFVITWWSNNQDGSGYGQYAQRYAADGTPLGGEFQVNTSTTNNQYKGAVAGLTGGGFVVTWQSQHTGTWQTIGQLFTANGTKSGGEFTVGTSGGQGAEASVLALSDGGFIVSWEARGTETFPMADAYARRYAADGTPVGAAFRINSTTTDHQFWAVQSQLSNGNIVYVWQSNGGQDGAGSGHFGRIFDVNGNALTGEFAINTFTANNQTYPQVAALSNGGFVTTWVSWYQDGDVHSNIYAQMFDASGNRVGGEFLVNTLTTSEQGRPEVTALPGGGFVVTWQTNPPGDLYVVAQVFDNAGNKVDGEFKINQTGIRSDKAAIAALRDGRVVITWSEYDTQSVYNSSLGQYTSVQSQGVFARIVGAATNTAPTAAAVTSQTATEDAAFSYQVGAFTDPGDTLTYTATKADGSALPAWLSFNAATRTFSGTPANGDVGSVSVKVTATDSGNATAAATFQITVANTNDAPTAPTLANRTATVGEATTWTATAFSDVDAGDTLTYSATLADGSALPAWLSFNAATRAFSGTPPQGSAGAVTVKVTATDTAGATASASFSLTVSAASGGGGGGANSAPVVAERPSHQLVVERQPLNFTVPAGTFTDADGDTLTLTATQADGTALPGWIRFDPATRTFSGVPGLGDVGTAEIKLTATDPSGATASTTFKVTVGNVVRPPPLPGPPGNRSAEPPQVPPPPLSPIDRSGGGSASPFANPLSNALLGTAPGGFDSGSRSAPGGDGITALADTRVVAAGDSFQVSLGAEVANAASITLTGADGQAAPGWIKVDPATGTVTGTPPAGFQGEVVLNVVVKDAQGREVTKQVVVKVEGKSTGQRSGQDRQAAAKPGLDAQLGKAGRTAFAAQRAALTEAIKGVNA